MAKNDLTKKRLIAAYEELDKKIGIDPPIEYDEMSQEDFEQELFDIISDPEMVTANDKFSKVTEATFDLLREKFDEEETEEEEDEEDEEEEPAPKKGKKAPAPAPAPAPVKGKKAPVVEEEDEEDEEEEPAPKKGKKVPAPAPVKGKKAPVVEEEEEEEEEEPVPGPKKGKKVPAPAPVKEKKIKKEEGSSASDIVRELTCKNPKITTEEIQKVLQKNGLEQSPISINIRRMEMLHAIKIIKKFGLPK